MLLLLLSATWQRRLATLGRNFHFDDDLVEVVGLQEIAQIYNRMSSFFVFVFVFVFEFKKFNIPAGVTEHHYLNRILDPSVW